MDLINFFIFISVVSNLSLGLIVFARGRENNSSGLNRAYLFLALSVAYWSLSMFFYRLANTVSGSIFWCKLLYSAPPLIILSFLYFSLKVSCQIISPLKKIAVAISSVFVFFLSIFTNRIVNGVVVGSAIGGEKIIIFGDIYYVVYPAFVILGFLWSYFILTTGMRRTDGALRAQINYVFWGSFLSSSVGMITNLLMPTFGIFTLNWLGQVSSLIMVAFIAYAITRYYLMGVRVVLSRIFFYLLATIFLVFVSCLAIVMHGKLFTSLSILEALALGFPLAFLVVYFFRRFSDFIERLSDDIFYSGRNPQKTINELVLKSSQTGDMADLSDMLIKELKATLKIKAVGIVLFLKSKNRKNLIVNKDFDFQQRSDWLDVLTGLGRIKEVFVVNDAIGVNDSVQILKNNGIGAVLPLVFQDEMIGAILLSNKENASFYTKEEIDFLKIVSSQISVAFINAHVRNDLEFLVEEISNKNERLEELLKIKYDFLRIANHQLNTPLSIMRNAFELMEDKTITVKEGMKIFSSGLTRISNTIRDFWSVFEIEGKGVKCNFEGVDVVKIVKSVVKEKKKMEIFIDRGLKIQIVKPEFDLPIITADSKMLAYAISNILDNAIFYTTKGKVEIRFERLCSKGKNLLKISISDTGCGVVEEDKKMLFSKFHRGKNAGNIYPNGSGLGLYLAKKIISSHGGGVFLDENRSGYSSTFSLTLPIQS